MKQWFDYFFVVGFGVMLGITITLICRRLFLLRQHRRTSPAATNSTGNHCPIAAGDNSGVYFKWEDNPTLVREATDYGWPRFAFTELTSSPSLRLAAGDDVNYRNAEVGWELPEGSADYMQRVRLNPGIKKISPAGAITVTRAALPLPGPQSTDSIFPAEAYFEITIVPGENDNDNDNINAAENEVSFSMGLIPGGAMPLKIPGRRRGSVGFNSAGDLFFDGNKLARPRKGGRWEAAGQVIGCGYNPSQKRVFFTVDSHLVYEVHCDSPEFGHPLYPALASDGDIAVLVNLGQCMFKYTAANMQRSPNPCIFNHHGRSTSFGSDDMFSIGRIDSQWRQLSTARISSNAAAGSRAGAAETSDMESEAELFEIVLDISGRRSPAVPYKKI
ncbi:uncharacterized protein LOC127264340 [Andrographis paniculata]|uniref:uncharacterized protein LOC127264340 n=1 Tax=Andrographis paniculata TaxID=175694 RepID=UPI0021E90D43|nr:uncharacterized protein LOC127264340 [Andrographis paniculata]